STKLVFFVVLLIFVVGETSNITTEGSRIDEHELPPICTQFCHKPCSCFNGNCLCPKLESPDFGCTRQSCKP
ncbi:hypothetical protein LINGRAHAP2_LOCUS23556, partial [Linum grandiflorum]